MISLQAFSLIFVSKNIYVRELYQLNMATLWLIFAFFSYLTDLEKQLLAQQTSLSRNLVDPFLLYHCCLLDFYLPTLNRNRRPYVVILMGLALSNTKILHYQQIEEHFVLLLIEYMKLVGNIKNVILEQCIYAQLFFLIHMTLI